MSGAIPDQQFNSDSQRTIGRVGDTVHRTVGPWTSAVHGLLKHLEQAGFASAPRVLDSPDPNVEVLTYIEGESGKDVWAKIARDKGLIRFAQLLRRYHDAVAAYRPTPQAWSNGVADLRADDIICHGDFGPWNTVWREDEPVGIVDWDLAGPRPKLYDIAYALEYTAPFRDDEECTKWLGYPAPPDRVHRIQVFAEAYGLPSVDGLYDEVVKAQEAGIEEVRLLAEQGFQPQAGWVTNGHLEELQQRVVWSRANRSRFMGLSPPRPWS